MATPNQNPKPLAARPAPPEAEAWHDYLRRQKEEAPQRLEEAAKFLSGMVAITLGVVAGNLQTMLGLNRPLTMGCLVVWLMALVGAFMVVFPLPYQIVKDSADSIAHMHQKAIRRKYRLLVLSMVLFVAALVMLVLVYTCGASAGADVPAPPVVSPADTL